jgi:hypothetical protein
MVHLIINLINENHYYAIGKNTILLYRPTPSFLLLNMSLNKPIEPNMPTVSYNGEILFLRPLSNSTLVLETWKSKVGRKSSAYFSLIVENFKSQD